MDPVPRQLQRAVGLLAEQHALPPPLPVALAIRDLLAVRVEVFGETFREPDVRDELGRGLGALTATCKTLLTSLGVP